MRKISLMAYLLGTVLFFTGCVNEEDDLFDKSAAERLNEVVATYTERLVNSPAGWAIEYYPTPETLSPTDSKAPKTRGYLTLGKFISGGSVNMGMDISGTEFVTGDYVNQNIYGQYVSDQSTWDVITDTGPVLSFNSYNKCLHIFSDPSVFKTGEGLEGDYEFVIIDLPEEGYEAMLKGKKRGAYIHMTKLDEGTDFKTYLEDVNSFTGKIFSDAAPNSNIMMLGGERYRVESASTGIMNIYPYNGDNVADEDFYPFLITKRGGKYYLRFRDVVTKGDAENEATAQTFIYDDATDKFVDMDNESNVIEGPNPNTFIYSYIGDNHKIQWDRQSEGGGSIKEAYENVYQGFRRVNYTLSNAQIFIDETNGTILRINYRTNRGVSATLDYKFSLEQSDDAISLQYVEPLGASGNVLNTIPSLLDLLNALSGTFNASKTETGFDLTRIKLTSSVNPNDWFVVLLIN